jgi:hypothetical protein
MAPLSDYELTLAGFLFFCISLISSPPSLVAQETGFVQVLSYDSLRLAPANRKLATKLRGGGS